MTQQLARADDGYQAAKDLARDNLCANGHELVVKWSTSDSHYVAVCVRRDCEGAGIRSRRDADQDDLRERFARNPQLSQSLAVRDVPLTTQAIRELDNDKLMARVPDRYGTSIEVSKPMKLQLAQLARLYGLDPLWDLMVFEGHPFVTYDGRLRKLREHPDYRNHRVRPLNKTEKEEWGYEPGDLVIQCDVDMGQRGVITDWGIVRATEVSAALERAKRDGKKSAPVGIHPQQIAIKRAVARASRQAVGIDLPTVIESQPGRVIVQEMGARPPSAMDSEMLAQRRFWSTARSGPPDGLGLSDAEVHRLLGVETLTGYPGGWEQALSDLTERAAQDGDIDYDDDGYDDERDFGASPAPTSAASQSPAAVEQPGASVEAPHFTGAPSADPEQDDMEVTLLDLNGQMYLDANSLGLKQIGHLHATADWSDKRIQEANEKLDTLIRGAEQPKQARL